MSGACWIWITLAFLEALSANIASCHTLDSSVRLHHGTGNAGFPLLVVRLPSLRAASIRGSPD